MSKSVPLLTIFVISAVVALLASSLIAWQLTAFVANNDDLSKSVAQNLDELVLAKTGTELTRVRDFLTAQLERCTLAAEEVRRFALTTSNDAAIRTFGGALAYTNQSFFQTFVTRYSVPHEIYGVSLSFSYPPDQVVGPQTTLSFQAYADPLRTGARQNLFAWGDPATALVVAYPVFDSKVGSNNGTAIWADGSQPQYSWDQTYFATPPWNSTEPLWEVLPWLSGDSNAFFFIQVTHTLWIRGVNVQAQAWLDGVDWETAMLPLLESANSFFLVYDANLLPVATSFPPEISRRRACLANATDPTACISFALPQHPTTLLSFVYNQTTELRETMSLIAAADLEEPHFFLRTKYRDRDLTIITMDPLLMPPRQSLHLVLFAFITPSSYTQGSTASVVLIVFIFAVAFATTLGVGVVVRVLFVGPMTELSAQMEAVTDLDTDAIASAAMAKGGDDAVPIDNTEMVKSMMDRSTVSNSVHHTTKRGVTSSPAPEGGSGNGGSLVSFDEIEAVRTSFGKMAASIQWFLLYLPGDVVKDMMAANKTALTARSMEPRELTLLFADIRSFTQATGHLEGQIETYMELLQLYFEHCSNALTDEGCTIDKYIGDCIMGFWGAPLDCIDQGERACMGALRMASVVEALGPQFEAHGWDLGVRIGVHTGNAMVGSIGSRRRLNYTALGETVNVASRIEGLCKYTHSTILVSESTVRKVRLSIDDNEDDNPYIFRRRGTYLLKGVSRPFAVYDLTGLTPSAFDTIRHAAGVASTETTVTPAESRMSMHSFGTAKTSSMRRGEVVISGPPSAISAEEMKESGAESRSQMSHAHSRRRSQATDRVQASRSRSKKARSTLRGLSRHFRVPYEAITRVDIVNEVYAHYDQSSFDGALQGIDALLRNRDLLAAEMNEALPETVEAALQFNRVTRADLAELREMIVRALGVENFDPIVAMTEK